MNTWNERLAHAIETTGAKKKDVARAAGVRPSSLQEWIHSGTQKLDAMAADRMCDHLGIRREWLLYNRGAMMQGTSAQDAAGSPSSEYQTDLVRIPLLTATASMGKGIDAMLEHDEQVGTFQATSRWIRARLSHASSVDNIRIITGLGDSMSGTFNNGDALFVDIGITALDVDAVYVIDHNDELFVKRIQRDINDGSLLMISDNPRYQSIKIPASRLGQLRVIGRVIGAMNYSDV